MLIIKKHASLQGQQILLLLLLLVLCIIIIIVIIGYHYLSTYICTM